MDYNRNVDKLTDWPAGVSFNQVLDVDNGTASALFTVSDFKDQYGKVDNADEDILIALLIPAATKMCENYVGMNFTPRSVVAYINNLNGGTYLPYGPVGAIASVSDIDGNVLETGNYKITGIKFQQVQWPTTEYLVVTYTGGYTTCPQDLVNAVKAQTLFLYENRGDSSVGMSPLAMLILNPLKRI